LIFKNILTPLDIIGHIGLVLMINLNFKLWMMVDCLIFQCSVVCIWMLKLQISCVF